MAIAASCFKLGIRMWRQGLEPLMFAPGWLILEGSNCSLPMSLSSLKGSTVKLH